MGGGGWVGGWVGGWLCKLAGALHTHSARRRRTALRGERGFGKPQQAPHGRRLGGVGAPVLALSSHSRNRGRQQPLPLLNCGSIPRAQPLGRAAKVRQAAKPRSLQRKPLPLPHMLPLHHMQACCLTTLHYG